MMQNLDDVTGAAQSGGNGKRQGIDAFLGGLGTDIDFQNVLRDLIRAGKDVEDQLPRSVFKDQNAVNKALQFLHKVERYGMAERYKRMIMRWLVASAAIDGRARKEVLQGHVGILAPTLYNKRPTDDVKGRKGFLKRFKKDDDDE